MKKFMLSAIMISILLVTGCSKKPEEKKEDSSAKEEKVTTGIGTNTWHDAENTFTAIVTVTTKDDIVEKIELSDTSNIHTGSETFVLWTTNKETYMEQYIGKTIEELLAMEVEPSKMKDHFDGGSMKGCIDAISGATASSVTYALAVQDALSK